MKRKFKRDYIIFEAKDMNYKYKDKLSPKAFGKIELSEEKYVLSLYVENLKPINDGYNVSLITSNYDVLELGNINLNESGKGEKIFTLNEETDDIKAISLIHSKSVVLIGFKGAKLNNYEEILFPKDRYNGIEYIEVDNNDDDDIYEYEYVEVEDDEPDDNIQQDNNDLNDVVDEFTDNKKYNDINDYKEYDNIEYVKVLNKRPFLKNNKESIENKDISNKNNSANKENLEKDDYLDEEKIAQRLLMPRQIKKGLKMFREVKPFYRDYIDKSRWWKIDITPITLCGYSMPNLGYINTLNYTMYSDTVVNSYKYRHYLFGVQYDDYNRRKYYVYGVPGKKDEQPDKGLTGFIKYQPCDTRNENIGYWLCFVDCRTRKILKKN